MESGEKRQKRGSGGNNINSLPAPPPLQPHRCLSAHFSLRCPHYFGPVDIKVGEPRLSIKSPPPSTPSLFFCSLFFALSPLFWFCLHESGGTRAVHKIPPPPLQPYRCFSAHFALSPLFWACLHESEGARAVHKIPPPLQPYGCFSAHFALAPLFWACLHESGGTRAVHKIPPPLQPHRCFSAHFSLRCPHYFGSVYTKVGEPGLSIKSPPPHFNPIAVFLLTLRCPHYFGPVYMKLG